MCNSFNKIQNKEIELMVLKYTLFFTIALLDVNVSIPKILTLIKCLISIVLNSKQAKIIFLDILVCIFVKLKCNELFVIEEKFFS